MQSKSGKRIIFGAKHFFFGGFISFHFVKRAAQLFFLFILFFHVFQYLPHVFVCGPYNLHHHKSDQCFYIHCAQIQRSSIVCCLLIDGLLLLFCFVLTAVAITRSECFTLISFMARLKNISPSGGRHG
jgi:hypothetical protein